MRLERWDWAKLRKEVESGKEPRPEAVTKKKAGFTWQAGVR